MESNNLMFFLVRINELELTLRDAYKLAPLGRALLEHQINDPDRFPMEGILYYLKYSTENHPARWKLIQHLYENLGFLLEPLRTLDKDKSQAEKLWGDMPFQSFLPESYIDKIRKNLKDKPQSLDVQTGLNLMGRFILDYVERSLYLLDRIAELKKYILISFENPDSLIGGFWGLIGVSIGDDTKDINTDRDENPYRLLEERIIKQLKFQQDEQISVLIEMMNNSVHKDETPYPMQLLMDANHIEPYEDKYIVITSLPKTLDFMLERESKLSFSFVRSHFLYRHNLKPYSKNSVTTEIARARARYREKKDQ